MANPFTAFGYPITGAPSPCTPCNRTTPDRLAQIKNVKDFGAKGDGVTDDWAAIMAAVNWTTNNDRGTIYFPPGTYLVSQKINFSGDFVGHNINIKWVGEMGLSTITGNFADFIFYTNSEPQITTFDKLTIVNTNAAGGGIEIAGSPNNQAIRNCAITANFCINLTGTNNVSQASTFETTVENCILSPGSTVSGSIGISSPSNGPIANCSLIGFDYGMLLAGQEGATGIVGCYFQGCLVGLYLGVGPDLVADSDSLLLIGGCWFKNCSTAINFLGSTGGCTLAGVRIEATNGQVRGGNGQYGIVLNVQKASTNLFAGVAVLGSYDHAGIYIPGGTRQSNTFAGCHSVSWSLTAPENDEFIACDAVPVFTVANLLASGQQEGDLVNVSDGTNSLAWGATVTNTGTHATHYLARYNGSNYTVMGQ